MTIFTILGLLHLIWASGGSFGAGAVVPSVAGKPLFRPSALATVLVAAALFTAALVISGAMGWLGAGVVPDRVFQVLSVGVALVFLLRAIGDFRYVGFFKPQNGSAFAAWDTWLYSPLCLFIALSAFYVARRRSS